MFNHGFNSTTGCSEACASECTQSLRGILEFRAAVYAAATPVPVCRVPAALAGDDNTGNAMAVKNLLGDTYNNTYGGATPETYGLTQAGQWGVSWQSGDKVIGQAICSASSSGTPVASTGSDALYCWCKATNYVSPSNSQCSFSDSSWYQRGAAAEDSEYCLYWCGYYCANDVRTWPYTRVLVLDGLFEQ